MVLLMLAFYSWIVYLVYYVYHLIRAWVEYFKYGIPWKIFYPFVGNLGEIFLQKSSFWEKIQENYQMCPNARFSFFYNCTTRMVLIRDLELMKSILVKHSDTFRDHLVIADKELDPIFASNIINLKGEKWRHVRTVLTPAFTTHKIKHMFELVSECAENFTSQIWQNVTENGENFEMKDLFSRYANDAIANYAFGVKMDSLADPENKFYALGHKVTNFEGLLSLKLLLAGNFPRLAKFFKLKLFGDEMNNHFQGVIESAVKSRDEMGVFRPDFLQFLMDLRGTKNEMNITEMASQAFGFYLGGIETNCVPLTFIAYEIAVNLDVQKRLQKEIDEMYQRTNGNLTYDAISELAYLDAIVMEILRLYPPVILTDRYCREDFDLGKSVPGRKNYTMKRGDMLWIPIGMVSRDEKYFPEPEKFLPERFLDRKMSGSTPPFFPFGYGSRMCLGNRFSMVKLKIAIVHLLLRCELGVCEKTNIPMTFSKTTFMLASEGGCWLKIRRRSDSLVEMKYVSRK